MHKVPQDVIGRDVALLNAMDRVRRHAEKWSTEGEMRILPPSRPVSAIVAMPMFLAASKAASTLTALPLVEMPITASPFRACAKSGRTKACWKPRSLPIADIIAVSAVRLMAGNAGRPAVTGCRNSTAICAASQLDPPLPIV